MKLFDERFYFKAFDISPYNTIIYYIGNKSYNKHYIVSLFRGSSFYRSQFETKALIRSNLIGRLR